jgi:hypothetical protein
MKKLVLALMLATLSSTALANPYYRHSYNNGGDVLLPLIIGGTLGYIIAQPRTVVQQPQVIQTVPRISEPVYQYQDIYFTDCNCYKRVLVQIN